MNSVSWFLYLADILSGVQFFSGFVGLIITIVGFAMACASFVWEKEKRYLDKPAVRSSYDFEEIVIYPLSMIRPWGIVVGILGFIMMLFAIAIPSKETRFAIAASQVGEQIIQLEEVQEVGGEVGGLAKDAINLLRQNIQEQLTEKPVETGK